MSNEFNNNEVMEETTVTEEVTGEIAEDNNEVPANGKGKIVKIALGTGAAGLFVLGMVVFVKKIAVPFFQKRQEKKFHKIKEFEDDGFDEVVEE